MLPDHPLPRDLARALDWLRGHLDEPVRLAELARIAGVSPRTLEAHFRRFLGTTPVGWVRRLRLSLARRRLLAAGPRDTVTTVALASGFAQLGRFAGQYREAFGEAPSATLARARRRAARRPDEVDDEAVRLTWAASRAAYAVAPEACRAALDDLGRAAELAPAYGLAKALAAWCWAQRAAQHFGQTPEADLARAVTLAGEAVRLAPDDALALTHASGALVLAGRVGEADRLIERALTLDPWSPFAWLRRGWVSAYQGDGDAALGWFRNLMAYDSVRHTSLIGIGCAHFAAGRFDRAAKWAATGVEAYPAAFWGERVVAAAAVHAGARAEGERAARRLLSRDPELTVEVARRAWPFPPAVMDRLADGLAKAGVPRA